MLELREDKVTPATRAKASSSDGQRSKALEFGMPRRMGVLKDFLN
jgi:hypothetical protein